VLSTQRKVRGREVTAIGDSVMSAGAMALDSVLPGIYIDAKPDREMPAGLDILRGLADSGRLRPIVVVGLGTNYIVTTAELQELMRPIGPDQVHPEMPGTYVYARMVYRAVRATRTVPGPAPAAQPVLAKRPGSVTAIRVTGRP